MWVEGSEVEFSGDREDDRADGRQPAIASGLELGRLEESVDYFEIIKSQLAPAGGLLGAPQCQ